MEKHDIVILGAGLTGLSAGYHLGEGYVIFEAKPWTGGMAGSYSREGFTFDHGGVHVLRMEDNYLQGRAKAYYNRFQREMLKDNVSEKQKRAYVYFQGNYHVRPFQHNLHGASEQVLKECLDGFQSRPIPEDAPEDFSKSMKKYAHFKEEVEHVFGAGLCKYFMYPYNRKAWGTKLEKIRSKMWISKNFGTTFDPHQFVEGIKYPNSVDKSLIRYPLKGGFGATGDAIYRRISHNVQTSCRATHIDVKNKIITINGERKIAYNQLVSTIPIPELIKIIPDASEELKEAAESLLFASMITIDLGIDKPVWTDKQYIYFPDEDVVFTRVGFPVNQSPFAAPEGKTGIGVEIPYSKEMKVNRDEVVEQTMKDLVRCGILQGDEKILFCDVHDVTYSYVVQNVNLDRTLKLLRSFLRPLEIFSIGRYGEWKHSGTEHAVDDGRKVAEKLHFDSQIHEVANLGKED